MGAEKVRLACAYLVFINVHFEEMYIFKLWLLRHGFVHWANHFARWAPGCSKIYNHLIGMMGERVSKQVSRACVCGVLPMHFLLAEDAGQNLLCCEFLPPNQRCGHDFTHQCFVHHVLHIDLTAAPARIVVIR